MDPNDPGRETGGTRYLVKIAGGQTLVDGSSYQQLECNVRDGRVNQSDADGLYDISWTNGNTFTMTNPSIGGKLQGLIEMRDGNNNYYFNGKVTDVQPVNPGYHSLTVQVTDENLLDLNKSTLPKTGTINLGNKSYAYTDWKFNEADGTYTFTIDDAKCDSTIGANATGLKAQVGDSYDYQGIPYYMEQMNEFLRSFTQKFNKILKDCYTSSGGKVNWVFTGKKNDGGQFDMGLDANGEIDKNKYYQITAFNFQINQELIDDPSKLATKTNRSLGVDAYDVITNLIKMMTDKSGMSFRGGSAGEFLDCLLSDVALNASSAETFTKTFEGIKKSVENQRLSVMGVDEEEEGVQLVRFQYNYNLASKMIQVLSEVYDRLILETGV